MMRLYTSVCVTAPVQEANTNFGIHLVKVHLERDRVLNIFYAICNEITEIKLYNDSYDARQYPLDLTEQNQEQSDKLSFFKPNKIKSITDEAVISLYGEENVFSLVKEVTIVYQLDITDVSILRRSNKGYVLMRNNDSDKVKLELANVEHIITFATEEFAKKEHIATTIYLISHKELTTKKSSCVLL